MIRPKEIMGPKNSSDAEKRIILMASIRVESTEVHLVGLLRAQISKPSMLPDSGTLFQSRAPALLGDKNVLRRYRECRATDPLSLLPPSAALIAPSLLWPATVYSPTAPNTTCLLPGRPMPPHPTPTSWCFTVYALAFHPGEPLLCRAPHISPLPFNPPPSIPPYSPSPPTSTAGGGGGPDRAHESLIAKEGFN